MGRDIGPSHSCQSKPDYHGQSPRMYDADLWPQRLRRRGRGARRTGRSRSLRSRRVCQRTSVHLAELSGGKSVTNPKHETPDPGPYNPTQEGMISNGYILAQHAGTGMGVACSNCNYRAEVLRNGALAVAIAAETYLGSPVTKKSRTQVHVMALMNHTESPSSQMEKGVLLCVPNSNSPSAFTAQV